MEAKDITPIHPKAEKLAEAVIRLFWADNALRCAKDPRNSSPLGEISIAEEQNDYNSAANNLYVALKLALIKPNCDEDEVNEDYDCSYR